MNRGFLTLEILIAFAVMTLSITAVILVAFGNQSFAISTNLSQRALYLAKSNLDSTIANAIGNFNTVAGFTITPSGSEKFTQNVALSDISQCAKEITSNVTWTEGLRNLDTDLVSSVASSGIAAATGYTCSPNTPSSDWDTPNTLGSYSPSWFDGNGTGIAVANINGTRYAFMTTDEHDPHQMSKNNFYAINTHDPANIGVGDVYGSRPGKDALNGLAVAKINGGTYAFVLNNNTNGQLQVIDVSDPTNPSRIASASSTLPDITNAYPRSIFYYDKKVYIGTQYVGCVTCTPNENNEFHIYDVSDPAHPIWKGSINVDRNVNDIMVANGLAYLATGQGGDQTPLHIYDIDPSSPHYLTQRGSFGIGDNIAGTGVYVLGHTLYLGLKRNTTENDFYILNVSDPTLPAQLSANSLDENNSSVSDIVTQGPYAFIGILGTGSQDGFQIWNIANAASPYRINVCTAGSPFPQNMTGLTYRDDLIFASFRSNRIFRIIYDTADVCVP